MLKQPDVALYQALARVEESADGQALLAWLEESRAALRDSIDATDDDRPIERGASRVIGEAAKALREARERLAKLERD
jgi:hypothetical protein